MTSIGTLPIVFLSNEDVLQIHQDTLLQEGGAQGLRDITLLKSSVMMPQQQFGGGYLHDGLAAMAAAYMFHLCANHPFADGNKRAGVLAALVFLKANGVTALPDPVELESATWTVADGSMTKAQLTDWFRQRVDL